ncbi:MAG: hypothetical protein Q9182_000858 [Xanthomendoza sp. 2 TL-2023]
MYHSRSIYLLFSVYAAHVLTDFLAPPFPQPRDLTSNKSLVSTAWGNVSATIDSYLNDSSTDLTGLSGLKNLTFSLGMYSIHDPLAAEHLQYHFASAEVANSTTGATKVNGNSVYRVASVTKLITAFAGLLELSNSDWDRPITDFVPSLAEYARSMPGENDRVNTVEWNKVTLAALAAHLAGGPRDVTPYDPGDYLYDSPNPVAKYGLPPLNLSDPLAVPPCARLTAGNCSGNEYAKGAQARPPVFLPWTSPEYTDFGYMMLGLAITNITGKSIHEVYRESIFSPLDMNSSVSLPSPDNTTRKNYVIPGDIKNGFLEQIPQVTIPSGGIFSTTNDLAKLGTAILNSTLLPPDQTRKWMKPVSHTANLAFSVGRAWEIYRYTHPSSGIITDIYTKAGDAGAYGGFLILIPDFNAGFSILGASSLKERTTVTLALADLLIETMMPALLAQAESEAAENFLGTYSSSTPALNTTLTLTLNHSIGAPPGLSISTFISNGTDVLATKLLGSNPIRLLPTISDPKTHQIAFRTSAATKASRGLFSRMENAFADWLVADAGTYGGVAVGLFVFEIGEGGRAEKVRVGGWRVRLDRKS